MYAGWLLLAFPQYYNLFQLSKLILSRKFPKKAENEDLFNKNNKEKYFDRNGESEKEIASESRSEINVVLNF